MATPTDRPLRFLLVSPTYACKPVTGAGQRTSLIFNTLKTLGSVDVLLVGDVKYEKFKAFFLGANALHIAKPGARSELGIWRFLRPLSPGRVDAIAIRLGAKKFMYEPDKNVQQLLEKLQSTTNYDLVVGRYLRPTVRSGALCSKKVPVVLDVDDRDDVVYKSRLNLPGLNPIQRFFFQSYFRQTQAVTTDLLPRFDHVWLTSEADVQEVVHPSKSILPNIPYTLNGSSQAAFEESRDSKVVLFVGSYAHRVNAEGVERFVLNCWPKINAAVKDATLRIVGSGNWQAVKDKFDQVPNVETVGFVEDLAEEYQKSAFTIAPLFEGGGTKIKVLETLFYQRTAVITDHAQYGYDNLKHKESLWVAATEAELIEGCIHLLSNPDLRAEMAAKGRETVVREYSFERFSNLIRTSIEKFMPQRV
ncbi:glycosyltransferase family 4 protein [cf. Phormidesmis sp. LEGE 11477]|uniref:glycosyltransferase family 4 protein n=1 Tax=cf. Phormidesmis sp. LEGE 11477 TaxID=1828680 RepID=UPI0018804A8D|nr:glycosyltransferase [cf. Phormidesmis sp. LEGE 11477]MBE9062329.1 glycosyltransferase [cf. Phormidesmis sp. LEGE 11477]